MLAELGATFGVALARSVSGWLENAMQDGEVSKYEWQLLGATTLKVALLTAGTYFSLNGVGIDVSVFASAASAVLLDIVSKR